jgi:hypothetical protein
MCYVILEGVYYQYIDKWVIAQSPYPNVIGIQDSTHRFSGSRLYIMEFCGLYCRPTGILFSPVWLNKEFIAPKRN